MEQNRSRISDAAASILFVASHPSFDSENMRDYVLTSAILSGAADNFDAEIQSATEKIRELEKFVNSAQLKKKNWTALPNDMRMKKTNWTNCCGHVQPKIKNCVRNSQNYNRNCVNCRRAQKQYRNYLPAWGVRKCLVIHGFHYVN